MSSTSEQETTAKRVAALRAYDILDTPAEGAFDDLTRLASYICKTPIATVTLLDGRRQWFKSAVGWDPKETPIEGSFCGHAIRQPNLFVVPDATLDPRFADSPLVTSDPHIRFYAGAPLITPEGVPLGTLCAIDQRPRELDEKQRSALKALARQATMLLELRRSLRLLRATLAEKQAALDEVNQLRGLLPMCSYCKSIRDDEDYWHEVGHYISDHSRVEFSHGVCPSCLPEVMKNAERDVASFSEASAA